MSSVGVYQPGRLLLGLGRSVTLGGLGSLRIRGFRIGNVRRCVTSRIGEDLGLARKRPSTLGAVGASETFLLAVLTVKHDDGVQIHFGVTERKGIFWEELAEVSPDKRLHILRARIHRWTRVRESCEEGAQVTRRCQTSLAQTTHSLHEMNRGDKEPLHRGTLGDAVDLRQEDLLEIGIDVVAIRTPVRSTGHDEGRLTDQTREDQRFGEGILEGEVSLVPIDIFDVRHLSHSLSHEQRGFDVQAVTTGVKL